MEEPTPTPENSGDRPQKNDVVVRFQDRYAETLAAAKVSAELTLTDGWRALYHAEREADRVERKRISDRMQALATFVENHGSDEDTEKAIGECKKDTTTARARRDAFLAATVNPVQQPVDDCRKVCEDARQQAYRIQGDAPLLAHGVVDRMRAAIEAVPKPEWDPEHGVVLIRQPGRSGVN